MSNTIKYQLTIDPKTQRSKPPKKEFGGITNRMNMVTGLTINELATFVAEPYSYTWTGSLFTGNVNNENWNSQSIFALDFDNGDITIEEVYEIFNTYNIVPQLWYNTLSDSESLRKFRVVLFLDTPVSDVRIHNLITEGLLSIFPQADKKCKNPARFFLGGKQSVVTNTNPISTERLFHLLSIELITKDGGRLRKIPSINFIQNNTGSGEKRTFLYNNYRSSCFQPISTTTPTTTKGGDMTFLDINVARTKVKVLDQFLNGQWFYHDELFGLATNLHYIKGGKKLMKDTMNYYNKNGTTQYTQNNFNIIPYISKVNYPPIPIHQFSPFEQDDDLYDLVSATKDIRGFVKVIEPINRIELSQAEEILQENYQRVIEEGEVGKIYLFSLPTAIGKTQSLTSTLATIALPTNDLKNEVGNRMEMEYIKTPDPLVFDNNSINLKLQYYYSIGLPHKSMEILNYIINSRNSNEYSSEDILRASQYIEQVQLCYSSPLSVLTTHKRVLHGHFPLETIIFDEDPISSLIDIKNMFVSDLFKLSLTSKKLNEPLSRIIQSLSESNPLEIKKTPTFLIDIDSLVEAVSETSIQSNVFDFLNSSFFLKDGSDPDLIHYVVKRDLPKDKKIIIMSATIPIEIYKKLYPNRIEVIDIGDVKQMGSVIQFTKRSCSRNSLNRYSSLISDEVGEKPVITFKTFSNQFKNTVKEMYFGNCSGYDTLKGKDIAVVGTPHRNNIEYFLTSMVLGIEFKTTQTTMSFQRIEYNGFKFKFNCFDNEDLRMVQLSLIQSDLIQAVGRARTLRTNSKVDLYSNFPLRISDEFIF
ncbi:hypothetical protein [Flavobacterium sp.]|uniref:hypothetical protein n=1 Tax=Flavobacterium sp. TaxID=239 RepID=UPI0025F57D61|nr:hypothetical protein [Flavobacterium sp.]